MTDKKSVPGGGAGSESVAAGGTNPATPDNPATVRLWRLKRAAGWMRIHVERSRADDGVRVLCGIWLPYGADLGMTEDTIARLRRPGVPVCGGCLRALTNWEGRNLS